MAATSRRRVPLVALLFGLATGRNIGDGRAAQTQAQTQTQTQTLKQP